MCEAFTKTRIRRSHAVARKPPKTSWRNWALWFSYFYHPLQKFSVLSKEKKLFLFLESHLSRRVWLFVFSFWRTGVSHALTLMVQVVLGADMVGDAPAPLAVEKQTLGCERAPAGTPREELRTASVAQCQLNLLEHVESLHHQISSRMDLVERELDGSTHTDTHTQSERVKLCPLRNSKNNGQRCKKPTLSFWLRSLGVLAGPHRRVGAS